MLKSSCASREYSRIYDVSSEEIFCLMTSRQLTPHLCLSFPLWKHCITGRCWHEKKKTKKKTEVVTGSGCYWQGRQKHRRQKLTRSGCFHSYVFADNFCWAALLSTSLKQDLSPPALWQGDLTAITQTAQEASHRFVLPYQGRCHNVCSSLVFAVFILMLTRNTHSFSSGWVG